VETFDNLLEDLVVLEIASVLAGPMVGTFFAELGAKVIKIENKLTGGDVTRTWKLAVEDDELPVSSYYASCNWGKDNVMLNLKEEEDYQIFLSFLEKADIVISNYLPNTAKKLKVDYETLKKHKTDLLFGEIIGYHATPNRPSYDMVLQAESGFLSMTGTPDGQPVKMAVPLIDMLAAHHLKEALLLAYIARLKDKKGRKLSVSLFEAAVSSLANQASNYLMWNVIPGKLGTKHPNIPIYGEVFKTSDEKEFIIAIASDYQFTKLYDFLGVPEEMRAETTPDRKRLEEPLLEFLHNLFRQKQMAEIKDTFNRMGVPYGEVKNVGEVLDLPQIERIILEDVMNTKSGEIEMKRIRSIIVRIEP
jgi:crotonobetainyl-CoA:carnitine CoA-transferase CaiB-like acyl-CoA transferase